MELPIALLAVSAACINGVCFPGNHLDRIHAAEEVVRPLRAERMAAWRR